MSTIKLLSENGEIFIIPIAAARLSEVLHAEIECLDSNSNDDNDDSDDDGGDAHDGRGKHRQVDSTNNKSTPPIPPLSSHTTQRLSSAVLRKIADFVTHYVTEAEMSPLEPPFASEDMYDIVQPRWYADFITVGVDHALLLDIISAANYLVSRFILCLVISFYYGGIMFLFFHFLITMSLQIDYIGYHIVDSHCTNCHCAKKSPITTTFYCRVYSHC